MSDLKSIVAVDDSRLVLQTLEKILSDYYSFQGFSKAERALSYMELFTPSLIILDIDMPEVNGYEMMKMIKEKNELKEIPIIFLTSNNEKEDVVKAAAYGVDDYVVKPFNPAELTARVKSQLRRYMNLGDIRTAGENIIVNGRLTFNLSEHILYADGEPVKLTPTEMKILELLMRNPGRIFPADEIYSRIWNEDSFSSENTVMVHIRRIREKIELNPRSPEYLKVVWGIGYVFERH